MITLKIYVFNTYTMYEIINKYICIAYDEYILIKDEKR